MGLLKNLFSKGKESPVNGADTVSKQPAEVALTYAQVLSRANTIPVEEKQYYQSDDYYSLKPFGGSAFEREVIPFEDRVKMSIPSDTGLYVPEILMLHFCKSFPNPKSGYPAYWWFKYGVRNVGAMLKSLEERGYIAINPSTQKYMLTPKGEKEQEDNAYVYYMHSQSKDSTFTAWEMNAMLAYGDKGRYLEIIEKRKRDDEEKRKQQEAAAEPLIQKLRAEDPEFRELDDENRATDKYIELVNKRAAQYREDKDLDSYIEFWEGNWKKNKPLLGSSWAFTLPDLYIKAKRYDEALACMPRLRKAGYSDKVEKYIAKINERKEKMAQKKK